MSMQRTIGEAHCQGELGGPRFASARADGLETGNGARVRVGRLGLQLLPKPSTQMLDESRGVLLSVVVDMSCSC